MPSEERQGELEAYPKEPSAPLREVVPPLLFAAHPAAAAACLLQG
jgi:hypothetical protein